MKNFIKKFYKICDLKTSSTPFLVCKKLSSNSIGKGNQQVDLLRLIFREDSLKIKKVLELVSRPHFPYNFLIEIFLLYYYINWLNFITRLCLPLKLFSKISFLRHSRAFDDVMTSEYLKS